ncbi:MAG: hypothetical protein AAGI23_16225 [Bacteroidota bacterium]
MSITSHHTFSSRLRAVREEAIDLLQPQQALEYIFLDNEQFLEGLDWGIPRYGHPEGKILYHIEEVLQNIDCIPNLDKADYLKLRLITFVHDTFKNLEDKARPRSWLKHHAVFARQFLSNYTSDEALLDLVELHDEAYYAWRTIHIQHQPDLGNLRKERLLSRMGDQLQLYYLFFKCDTLTGDKMPAPLDWFEEKIEGIKVVELC